MRLTEDQLARLLEALPRHPDHPASPHINSADFRGATLLGPANFEGAIFSGDAWFGEAQFSADARLGGTYFSYAGFFRARFSG